MLFLAVLGGAAVLEVHRALQPSAREARRLKQTEQELIKQLKVGEGYDLIVVLHFFISRTLCPVRITTY